MAYINSSTAFVFHCNDDPRMNDYIYNLTSSYADKSDEASVVATSVMMFVLSAVFFNLNLFSRVSDVSAVLNPTVRLVLSTSLSLFLPVMSYLFSEAKNNAPGKAGACPGLPDGLPAAGRSSSDLPLRARLILTWMLLVELLRKKVDAILVNGGVHAQGTSSSSIVNHVTSVVWLGDLVFFNLKGAGRKAVFGSLWVLCAAKLVQRIAIAELGKRSLSHGKNARLLSSYMAQILAADVQRRHEPAGDGSARLSACRYVVMGEENMVQGDGPHGYKLDLGKVVTSSEAAEDGGGVVTVGKIWQQLDEDERAVANGSDTTNRPHLIIKSIPRLKRLSLSFALFKLLRRRLEPLPAGAAGAAMSKAETDDCRSLIFRGLCKEEGVGDPEVALFQVLNDEVNLLSEYYHSVLPVMFASPYFFLVNYFLVPAVVFGLCAMTVVLCGNGNISFSFHSIRQDNYALSFGVISLTRCLWQNVLKSPQAFFSIIDISITYLLFLAFVYEEVWEFIISVLSNWFSVSLLCNYTAKPSWRQSPTISGALRRINWVRTKLSNTSLVMCKQFSVLSFCWLSMTLHTVPLPRQAKRSIMERLMAYADDDGGRASPLSNGRSALLSSPSAAAAALSRFCCQSDSVAEVIATWHVATSLLENKCPQQQARARQINRSRASSRHGHGENKMVATVLSKYCAYLLAFHPELLPDDQEGTKHVYEGMKKDLKKALGCWGYYLMSPNGRYNKLMRDHAERLLKGKAADDHTTTVVDKGVLLGKELEELVKNDGEESVWQLLARLWVELIVYIGPSGSEEHDKGHEAMLVQGGELITLLWALTTHTGIARPSPVVVDNISDINIEEGIHTS